MHAYIAGPLFNEGERWFNEQVDALARDMGLTTYLPQRDAGILKSSEDVARVFRADLEELERADVVIATLNGLGVDDGTAWELGYAHAKGTPCLGLFSDERVHARAVELNPMLSESLDALAGSLEELREALGRVLASIS